MNGCKKSKDSLKACFENVNIGLKKRTFQYDTHKYFADFMHLKFNAYVEKWKKVFITSISQKFDFSNSYITAA